jgi:hypothetical protein
MPDYMRGVRGALVITWGAPVAGREMQALRHLETTLQDFASRVRGGRLENPRFFIDTMGNASESMGMILVEGEIEELFGLLFDSNFQSRIAQAAHMAQNFTTRYYVAGAMAERARSVYGTAVSAAFAA